MPVVKKTVALHSFMDRYVRRLQAILINKGYNVTYSTALNYMVLYNVFDVQHRKMHPKVVELLQSFLNDRKTIKGIQREDKLNEYLEQSRKRIKERCIA